MTQNATQTAAQTYEANRLAAIENLRLMLLLLETAETESQKANWAHAGSMGHVCAMTTDLLNASSGHILI